ncbi:hypothetical protein N8I74_13060 [Chitiniphilus purpureus]|uniref:Tryptophan synthase subunit beta like protein n=1 Tax=Chitiniphilus purpureus TaxID=2981137 RepID=A0ABY6DMB4_9NEIS|nr:hypothetical protein [Chitiniphilus sp. CD1]UXY14241.1 hypothetical protein N8I74_13060 [Chitiniphilus sp. CD1]
MPYVRRNSDGRIVALFEHQEHPAQEFLSQGSPEVLGFLGVAGGGDAFSALDNDFVRVIEDLIDVLMQKNLLALTDLPAEAQVKLLARRRLRQDLKGPSILLDDNDVI